MAQWLYTILTPHKQEQVSKIFYSFLLENKLITLPYLVFSDTKQREVSQTCSWSHVLSCYRMWRTHLDIPLHIAGSLCDHRSRYLVPVHNCNTYNVILIPYNVVNKKDWSRITHNYTSHKPALYTYSWSAIHFLSETIIITHYWCIYFMCTWYTCRIKKPCLRLASNTGDWEKMLTVNICTVTL